MRGGPCNGCLVISGLLQVHKGNNSVLAKYFAVSEDVQALLPSDFVDSHNSRVGNCSTNMTALRPSNNCQFLLRVKPLNRFSSQATLLSPANPYRARQPQDHCKRCGSAGCQRRTHHPPS